MRDPHTLSTARITLMCRRCLAEIDRERADQRDRLIRRHAVARTLFGRRRLRPADQAERHARRHPAWDLISCLYARQELTARDLLARVQTAGAGRLRLTAEERRALAPFDAGPPAALAFEAGVPLARTGWS